MASVIDSFKEVINDNLAIIKIALLTIPTYYSYQLYIGCKNNDYSGFYFLAGITVFFLIGFIIKISSNVINERNNILPGFNPFPIIWASIKGILALFPLALILFPLTNYICSFIQFDYWIDITLKSIVWLVTSSLIVATFLMFCINEKILESFNFKVIFDKSGDLIFAIIFYIIKLLFINTFTLIFIGYTIFVLFGYGIFLDIFASFTVIFNVAVTGHYLGQLYYEIIGYKQNGA